MCHSFIIGDLIIDHTIFVRDIRGERRQRGNEGIYEVLRRTDMAGGASNCARILAALSDGTTYLWGVTGRSHWGPFRAILSHSQAVDGSRHNIEFRGIRDETEAQMNTVTRLIVIREADGKKVFRFGDRFDESGHLHVPPEKRGTAAYYLARACEKLYQQQRGKLDIIIINDFDMGCLTQESVDKIAEFAQNAEIPLFVNPRYDNQKYKQIRGTALLTDLKEWCRLANNGQGEDTWRGHVAGSGSLAEMAYRCFHYLGNFEYYIIKCEDAGTVFIAPSPSENEKGQYVIWKVPLWKIPTPPPDPDLLGLHQVGATDVMTAIFAMAFHRLVKPTATRAERTTRALEALVEANAVAAVYRAMPWHRMPNQEQVRQGIEKAAKIRENDRSGRSYRRKSRGNPRRGMLYLPSTTEIVLSDCKTAVDGFYSKPGSEFSKSLDSILKEWASGDASRHIILTAGGGSGKTTFAKFLAKAAPGYGIQFHFREKLKSATMTDQAIDEFVRTATDGGVLGIDEALGCGFEDVTWARVRMDDLKEQKIRLMLVDAHFLQHEQDANYRDQIISRCRRFCLMAPDQHPEDIPLIVANLAFEELHKKGLQLNSVIFQGGFLLAFIDGMLNEPTIRPWVDAMAEAVKLLPSLKAGDPVSFDTVKLPEKAKHYLDPSAARVVNSTSFTFKRERN